MRKVWLFGALAGAFLLAVLLEILVTEPPDEVPANRLVLELGGQAPRRIPPTPPADAPSPRRLEPLARRSGGPGRGAEAKTRAPVREVEVQANDSLWEIAERTLGSGTHWRRIADLNGIQPQDLRAGMTLRLPETVADEPAPPAGGARTHRVEPGETLGDIAARHLGSARRWKEILDLNGISDPTKVRAGTILQLPDS